MKRIAELRGLSEDHHHGLVLARKAKRAASGEQGLTVGDVWNEVEEKFEAELEPHFRIEEAHIAPALEAHGQAQLVTRLLDEHRVLRGLVQPDAGRASDDLERFGRLLEGHIRFEERELFEVAQQVLGRDELAAIERASRARPGRS